MEILDYQFLHELKSLPFVDAIYLYGSRARGDNQPRSDIDLAIKTVHATREDWVKVMDIIENADTLLKIDCVWLNDLKETDSLKVNIEKEKKILYEKQMD